jgi:hypothetical protein
MNKVNHNKIYTAAELRRYHSGQMQPDEMHVLERAALEDPMLADALEGYGKEKKGEESLALIRQKLDAKYPKSHAAKIVSFNKKIWSAVAVAASILLICGYAFFTMRTDNTSTTNETQIALKQSNTKNHKPQTKNIDKITPNEQFTTKPSTNSIQLAKKKSNDASTNSRLSLAASSDEGSFKTAIPYPEPTAAKYKDLALDNLSREDDLTEDNTKQIIDKKAVTASSTASRYFQTDSNLATNWAVAEVKNQQVALESSQQNNQFFDTDENDSKKNATSLDEVVVISGQGYRKERKKASVKATTAAVSKINSTALQNPFAAYLVNQHPTCYKTDDEKAAGNVVLDFKVDKKGRPMNIKVRSSLSDACDKEAIRLLSSGPDWEIKGPKLRKVVISFQ